MFPAIMASTHCMATHQAASNAASTNDSNSMLVDPSLAAGAVPDNSTASTQGADSTGSTQTSAPLNSMAPSDPLHTVQYILDNTWPLSLILDQLKSN